MVRQLNRIIVELQLKADESFSAFSDYIENMRNKNEFEALNNAISRKFGFDWYNFKGITLSEYKKVVYNGFKNNGRLGIESSLKERGL